MAAQKPKRGGLGKRAEETRGLLEGLSMNNGALTSTNKPVASAGKPKASSQPAPQAPAKKPSLMDLMRKATQSEGVQNVRETLGQAREVDSQGGILQYVLFRWELSELGGAPVNMPWDKQMKVLDPQIKKSQGIREMVGAIEAFHANDYLASTLEDVMKHFGIPLQTEVHNLKELQSFLERNAIAQEPLVTKTNQDTEDGITIYEDLADHTNHNTVTYLPKHGSKVAKDSWPVLQYRYKQLQEEWSTFDELRNAATPRLTPFKVSDKERNGTRRGFCGKLYVMGAAGDWAILINISRGENRDEQAIASIEKHVGLSDPVLPETPWDHKRHCLQNPKEADLVLKINQVIQDLNDRQRQRAVIAKEMVDQMFAKLEEATLPSEPEHRGLSGVVGGESGSVEVRIPSFWIRKRNGKVKEGPFGAVFESVDGELVVTDVAAAECFCFSTTLVVGKKLMFKFGSQFNRRTKVEEVRVELDIGAFCKTNGIKARLGPDDFQSLIMLARLVENRLRREDAFTDLDDEDEETEEGFEEESSSEAVSQS